MKRVSICPYWDFWRGNRMFDNPEACTCHGGFVRWRERAAAEGYVLATDDVIPPEQADLVWLMDLPARRSQFEALLARLRPGTKVVLQTMESPLYARATFDPRNYTRFDLVLSYAPAPEGCARQRSMRIPNDLMSREGDLPFAQRRCAIMVNANKIKGWWEIRRPGRGLAGLPGMAAIFSGWRRPWRTWLRPADGELYGWRRQLARAADRRATPLLDVYGWGWRGERLSWCRLLSHQPFQCAVDAPDADDPKWKKYDTKYELMGRYRFAIAVENFRGRLGYISEKPIDALRAGVVPVYMGEETICDTLPAGAFVDARKFSTPEALLDYLAECPEREWSRMRQAGREWLESAAARPFGSEAYAEAATGVLRELLG